MTKRNITIISVVVLAIAVLIIGLLIKQKSGAADYKDYYSANDTKETKIVKLWIGTRKMQDALGEKSLYPEYYRQVKTMEINGAKKEEILKKTEQDIIERYALYHNAKNKGFYASDKEVRRHVDFVISEMKKSDDYSKIEVIYEKEGTTFEKEYRANIRWNRFDATIKKWEKYFIKKASKNGAAASIEKKRRGIVAAYKKTDEYEALDKTLKECKKVLNRYGGNYEEIKKNGEALIP